MSTIPLKLKVASETTSSAITNDIIKPKVIIMLKLADSCNQILNLKNKKHITCLHQFHFVHLQQCRTRSPSPLNPIYHT